MQLHEFCELQIVSILVLISFSRYVMFPFRLHRKVSSAYNLIKNDLRNHYYKLKIKEDLMLNPMGRQIIMYFFTNLDVVF